MGRVVFGKSVLNAPISGRKCAYFRVTIEKYHSSNSDSGTDVLLDEHEFGEIIVFEENHYALIDLSNVKISVEADCFEEWNKFQSAPKAVAEFLASKGMTSNISMGLFDSLSCTEAVISEGKELVVAGKGYWADVAELGLDIPAQRILVMKPGEDGVVFVDCH